MPYQIKATHYYSPEPSTYSTVMESTEYGLLPMEFATRKAALAYIDELDAQPYYAQYGEACRPTYSPIWRKPVDYEAAKLEHETNLAISKYLESLD